MAQLTYLVVTKTAYNDLIKIDPAIRRRMKGQITDYMVMDDPLFRAEKLNDPKLGTYLWRMGDYRLIFDIDKNKIVLLRVQHRPALYSN